MSKILKQTITINNKKYYYTLKKLDKSRSFIECKGANLAQEFLNTDIPDLLYDLPELILAEKNYQKEQSDIIRFRVTSDDKKKIIQKALKKGYHSVSSFLRDLALGNS